MKTFVITAALLAPLPALAQDEVDDAPIVVTASRSGQGVPLADLGASATVIDVAALEQRQIRIVSDLLRDVPGVAVSRAGGVGGQTQIRIRGTEANHVLVLIDGIEVSDPFQGEYDFGNLLADDAARVEVLRGQQSSLYGSDAIGGVIQYLTLDGRQAPGVRLRAEGGSFGTVSGGARVAGASDAFDYAVNATGYVTSGTPTARGGTRDVGAESYAGSFKLGFAPSDAFKLSAVGRYARTDAEFNDTEFDGMSPSFGLLIDSPGVRSETEAFYGLVRADIGAGPITGALSAQIADTTRAALNRDAVSFGNEGRRYKGSAEVTGRLDVGDIRHKLTLALDLEREEFRNSNPSPSVFQGKENADNLGLVAQYELVVGEEFAAGASIRHDDNDNDLFDDATTVRAQASYRVTPGTRLRAAGGTGVKNPGFFELFGFSDGKYIGNPNLRPERSEGFEIGFDQEFSEALLVGLTYFDSILKDEIFRFFLPGFVASSDNRETRSTQRGVEAFVTARPSTRLRIDAAYTYLDSEENGAREVRRPRHFASANVSYGAPEDRFSATLTARYNGRQRDITFTPTFAPLIVDLDDYVLVNINAEYRLDRVTLFGRVENALDERYEEIFGYRASGAAVFAGVRARL